MSYDIVLLSTADWDNPFWTNKQYMASKFAEQGHRVLYVDSIGLRKPTAGKRDISRIIKRLFKGLKGLRKVQNNIWVYSPLVIPFHSSSFTDRLNSRIMKSMLRFFFKKLDFVRPIIWTYNPLSVDLATTIDRSIIVYHCVDDLSAAPGMNGEKIKNDDLLLAKAADIIFTTNPKLQAHFSEIRPERSFYYPNVVDYKHFSKSREHGAIPEDIRSISKPRIGFIGAISEYKVDFDLIEYIAKLHSEWHWVLVGQVGEGQPWTSIERLQLPNIHFLGPKPYSQLPAYLRGIDVATIPAARNAYTEAMFPMKFFEYLAAGKPVVATNIRSLQEYSQACLLSDTEDDFNADLERVLNGECSDPSVGIELAKKYTWDWRLKEMRREIEKVMKEKDGP